MLRAVQLNFLKFSQKFKNFFRLSCGAPLLFAFALTAHAQSVSIPLDAPSRPAMDIGDTANHTDLSLLEPAPNKLFVGASDQSPLTAEDFKLLDEEGVKFERVEARLPFTLLARVRPASGVQISKPLNLRLGLSRLAQPVMMRAELLRRLGYRVPATSYHHRLRVRFSDLASMDRFLRMASQTTITDFKDRGWLIRRDDQNFALELASVVLETVGDDRIDSQWGVTFSPHQPSQAATLSLYMQYRAFRALIVPFALMEVPESVNRYSSQMAAIFSGSLVINHRSAASFNGTTLEDVQWMVRKLSRLREKDWRAIVSAGNYPEEIEPVVYAKLLARFRHLAELVGLAKLVPSLDLSGLKFTSDNQRVVGGKVMQESFPGYPQRFAHGDGPSPFQDGDLRRYLGVSLKSTLIGEALARINEHLMLQSVQDLVVKRGIEIQNQIRQHILTNPFEPLYQKTESWGGPIGGGSVSAQRFFSAGTYFESTAPVQLIDTVSVSAFVGYFRTLDGLSQAVPVGMGNVSYSRSYTHVRPIDTIEQGSRTDWKDLMVPQVMQKLADDLKGSVQAEGRQSSLHQAISRLREGEIFTISDSLSVGASLSLNSTWETLLEISPLGFSNSLSLSGDARKILLQQTSIQKTADGFQVSVRGQKGNAYGVQLDANLYLNFLRVRMQSLETDIASQVFVLDYQPPLDPALGSDENSSQGGVVKDAVAVNPFTRRHASSVPVESKGLCPEGREPRTDQEKSACERAERDEDLRRALQEIFDDHSTDTLFEKFQDRKFQIKHDLRTFETGLKALLWKHAKYTEDHTVAIQFPVSLKYPELRPEDEEIRIFAHRQAELVGRDPLGFFLDILDGFLNDQGLHVGVSRDLNPNPSSTPYGEAEWRIIRAEVDISKQRKPLSSMASIQNIWGGWSLKNDKFLRLADQLNQEFREARRASYDLINKDAFAQVESLDFYRITANLTVMESGIERLKKLMTSPYLNLLEMIGHGDRELGRRIFYEMCKIETRSPISESPQESYTGEWLKGEYYPCLTESMRGLIQLGVDAPAISNRQAEGQWLVQVLNHLEDGFGKGLWTRALSPKDYLFFVQINGFRAGDEDGDLEFFSNTVGQPPDQLETAGGLMNYWARKIGVTPIEVERSQGSFR